MVRQELVCQISLPSVPRLAAFYTTAALVDGPGPITVDPRVLRAMSAQLVEQYDLAMTRCMNETMALYRGVFQTATNGPYWWMGPPLRESKRC